MHSLPLTKPLPSITLVDDNNLRGVIAPAKVLSRELLEDIVDLIEWSTPEAIRETEKRVAQADKKKSWIPLSKVIESAKKAE